MNQVLIPRSGEGADDMLGFRSSQMSCQDSSKFCITAGYLNSHPAGPELHFIESSPETQTDRRSEVCLSFSAFLHLISPSLIPPVAVCASISLHLPHVSSFKALLCHGVKTCSCSKGLFLVRRAVSLSLLFLCCCLPR